MMLVPIEGREDAGFGIGRRPLGGGSVTAHDRMFEWDSASRRGDDYVWN